MLLRLCHSNISFVERNCFELLMPFFHGLKPCEEDNHSEWVSICWSDIDQEFS